MHRFTNGILLFITPVAIFAAFFCAGVGAAWHPGAMAMAIVEAFIFLYALGQRLQIEREDKEERRQEHRPAAPQRFNELC